MDGSYLAERLGQLGLYDSFRHRLEYRHLTRVLPSDGELLAASGGVFRGKRWLIFLMSGGWFFVSANPITGLELLSFSDDAVLQLVPKKGLLFGSLLLRLEEKDEQISNMNRNAPNLFAAVWSRKAGNP